MSEPVRTGARQWPLHVVGCPGWDQLAEPVRGMAASVATELLWMLSGRRYGLTELTVRPCWRVGGLEDDFWRLGPRLPLWPYGWAAAAWCGCLRPACGCTRRRQEVGLAGPVHDVVRVRVDGHSVPEVAYRVFDHRWLVRVDGQQWPDRQDLTAADDRPGAFVVTYRRGVPVPAGGQYAAGHLACELAKAMVSDKDCRLPRRVQSVVRQGVQRTFIDPAELARDGLTGLPEVDQWLGAVNPHRLPRDSIVWSPDLTPVRRRTA